MNQTSQTASKEFEAASYNDIWGESESPHGHHSLVEDSTATKRLSSLYPRRVHEQSIRGDLLSVSAIDILPTNEEKIDAES
jgi:hypothetical protein